MGSGVSMQTQIGLRRLDDEVNGRAKNLPTTPYTGHNPQALSDAERVAKVAQHERTTNTSSNDAWSQYRQQQALKAQQPTYQEQVAKRNAEIDAQLPSKPKTMGNMMSGFMTNYLQRAAGQ